MGGRGEGKGWWVRVGKVGMVGEVVRVGRVVDGGWVKVGHLGRWVRVSGWMGEGGVGEGMGEVE